MPDVYREFLPWTPFAADDVRPLGRHVEHDPESKRYAHVASGRTLVAVDHPRHIGILDQGQVGSCTGNAATGALGTEPVELEQAVAQILANLNEHYALGVYSDAEVIDGDGPYPPNDNGSSGLSVAKVLKNRGLISGYRHAFSLTDALDALQDGPVLWGTNWLTGRDNVNSAGLIKYTGSSRGGHELVLRSYDPATGLVGGDNSWGATWGYKGSFFISVTDLGKSLADQGDITVLIPLSQPAPVPTPVPTPAPPSNLTLAEVLAFLEAWWSPTLAWAVDERHVGDNKKAAAHARTLAQQVGIYKP